MAGYNEIAPLLVFRKVAQLILNKITCKRPLYNGQRIYFSNIISNLTCNLLEASTDEYKIKKDLSHDRNIY